MRDIPILTNREAFWKQTDESIQEPEAGIFRLGLTVCPPSAVTVQARQEPILVRIKAGKWECIFMSLQGFASAGMWRQGENGTKTQKDKRTEVFKNLVLCYFTHGYSISLNLYYV